MADNSSALGAHGEDNHERSVEKLLRASQDGRRVSGDESTSEWSKQTSQLDLDNTFT